MLLLMKSAPSGLCGITVELQSHPQLREISPHFSLLSSFSICFTKSRGAGALKLNSVWGN